MLFCCALTDDMICSKNEQIEKLIKRLSNGRVEAMDELYSLIKTDIYAFALSKVGNSHDAEDILQDTFVQVYKYAASYKPQGKPLAWIFTIAANLANRKFQVSQRYTNFDEDLEEKPDGTHFESDVVDNEFIRQIMKILNNEEQQIVVLHIVSGLKHIEIAKLLGKPLSTVLSRYNRAIKKLQKSVKEEQ